ISFRYSYLKRILGLVFSNAFAEGMDVDLTLQDTVDTPGSFPAEGVHETLHLEGAVVENDQWYEPGCRLLEDTEPTEHTLGPYFYKPLAFEDITHFTGNLRYQGHTDAGFAFCLFNPAQGPTSCSAQEQISGSQLGWQNMKAPVMITDVRKILIGSKEGVHLKFAFDLANAGGGYIGGNSEITVDVTSQDLSFTCFSEDASLDGGQHLQLTLDSEQSYTARVECETFLTLDRVQTSLIELALEYSYVYPFTSEDMKLLPERSR
ncbi:MAG: hypothetical protein AABX72_01685, partial [Nanoarchaeota archaeon]